MSSFADVNVNDIKVHLYDNRRIQLSHNDRTLSIICPRMFMPFGMSGMSYNGDPPKYNIDFEMDRNNGNHIDKFIKWTGDFERHVIEEISKQSREIFHKHMNQTDLKSIYHSNIRENLEPIS